MLARIGFRPFSCARRLASHYQNEAGIYHLQQNIQEAVFGPPSGPATVSAGSTTEGDAKLRELAMLHLDKNMLLCQPTLKPQSLDFIPPERLGSREKPRISLDEHFQKIGRHMSQPYVDMINTFQASNWSPPLSDGAEFEHISGWVQYVPGEEPRPVKFPMEPVIVFDTEVMYEVHPFAVMATAVGANALYVWLSPWLLGETKDEKQLVPLGFHRQVVIGHNIGYDRKRVLEEYNMVQSEKWFMDTMGLHIAVNGMCNQQRAVYQKYLEYKRDAPTSKSAAQNLRSILRRDPWLEHTSGNGLDDTVLFHLGETVEKSDRDYFKGSNREAIMETPGLLDQLILYCARDSEYARRLFEVLLPKFLSVNPHPVSFSALRHMGSVFLPISEEWKHYVQHSEEMFLSKVEIVNCKLRELAEEAVAIADDPKALEDVANDPWLGQLDWTIKPVRMTKERKGKPVRPMKNQKLPGKPEWYRELFPSAGAEMNLTSRTRTTTILLRLKWDRYPLVWYDKHGWSFWCPISQKSQYNRLNFAHVEDDGDRSLFKLPHPDGAKARCTYPFAKFYLQYFEDQTLSSDSQIAQDAIRTNLMCSYWLSARQRILTQLPVYSKEAGNIGDMGLPNKWGMIIPRIVPLGAVTRRAVEDTWLTASNAKKNLIGSELKSNIKAPPGYKIIGADVDSEELWIASVTADSIFKMHGGTAIGWMTLEGTKQAKTDLHSKSAEILGINRNEAKTFNYGRLYGSGKASAARALRQFDPSLSVANADATAAKLYKATKGEQMLSKHFPLKQYWCGGSESVLYNQLELLANQPRQRTPFLGSGISDALKSEHLNKSGYMTTRCNWSIQSSGVDYLHLLIASMYYICSVYDIHARLLITVHDEVRYLVKEVDQYRAALALQTANLWTRALFCQQLGLENLPHSVAFFSAVDIDHVLRKEVNDPCVTPSHPEAIPSGESLDIVALLKKCNSLGKENSSRRAEFEKQPSAPREPVLARFNASEILHEYVEAQIGDLDDAQAIEKDLNKRFHTKPTKQANSQNRSRRNILDEHQQQVEKSFLRAESRL